MRALAIACALFSVLLFTLNGALARASDPPVVVVAPSGQADACLSSEHSGVNPPGSNAGNTVQLADRPCTTAPQSAAGQIGATQAGETRAPAQTSGGSAASTAVVTAADAVGLRIASIRIDARGIAKTRRLGVIVTVRDQRKRVVRYAVISLGCTKGAHGVAGCRQSSFSNGLGRASFRLKLGAHVTARRISLAVTARTPRFQARKLVTVRLPKLAT